MLICNENGFCSLATAQQAMFQRYFASPGEFMRLGADSIYTSFTEFSKAACRLRDSMSIGGAVALAKWGGTESGV